MPIRDRAPSPGPRRGVGDAIRAWIADLGGPPVAAPPRWDDLSERWWQLPPRVRQVVLVAAAASTLLVSMTSALRTPWGPPVTVAVLTADVGWAGEVAGAVALVERPAGTLPPDVLAADEATSGGARLRGPLPAGTVLRRAHLATTLQALEVGSGRAAVPLRADLVPAEVEPGSRVDVVAAGVDGRGHVLARGAHVLRATADAVWLDVTREEAVAVAGADGVDAVRLVLLGR